MTVSHYSRTAEAPREATRPVRVTADQAAVVRGHVAAGQQFRRQVDAYWAFVTFSVVFSFLVIAASGLAAPAADTTPQTLAVTCKVTPRQVYLKALGPEKAAAVPPAGGGGLGRKTVGQLCEETNTPVNAALARLEQAGFHGATAGSNMRELATKNGRRPIEVAEIVQGLPPTGEEGRR
jgi:hypothetical protein